jgi:hypothetical protein
MKKRNDARTGNPHCTWVLALSLALVAAPAASAQAQRAFPTAEGFGAPAVGGRGGRVLEVTNLDDSGPGSLRSAMEASGPRVVVLPIVQIVRSTHEFQPAMGFSLPTGAEARIRCLHRAGDMS